MYHISLYEEGRYCTDVGGAIDTLPQALEQMRRISSTLKADEIKVYFGYMFDRAGTTCSLIVTDRWHMPILQEKNEED